MVSRLIQTLPERQKATLALFGATSLYGLNGVLTRFLGDDFDAFTQFFARSVMVALILAFVVSMFHYRPWRVLEPSDVPWIIGWALSRSASAVLFFFAVLVLPIGMTAVLTVGGSLISAYAVGTLLFGEKITHRKLIAGALSMLGVVIISWGSFGTSNVFYIMLATSAGLIGSLWNVFSKKFTGGYSASQLAMIDAVLSALCMLPLMFIFGSKAPAIALSIPWLVVLAFAISQFLSVRLIVYGFRNLEAQVASLIMPVELFFAALYGLLLFGEVLSFTTVVGGLLVAAASISTTAPIPLPNLTKVGSPLYQRAYTFVRAAKPLGKRGEKEGGSDA